MRTYKQLKHQLDKGEITLKEFSESTLKLRRYKKSAKVPSKRPYHVANIHDLMYSKENIIAYFVSYIRDDELSEYIMDILVNKIPDYFWKLPSSSSGKYHPVDERGTRGLVLHTLRVFKVANELCHFSNVRGRDRDIVLISAILHDALKYDVPPGDVHTIPHHKTLVCEYLDLPDDISNIINATHIPSSDVDKLDMKQIVMYYADTISSREWIDIDITNKNIRISV